MATTIQLVSGNKSISLSKTVKPINIQKVERAVTLTHIGGPGPQGETGETGDPGQAATVNIGTVATGDPGTNASVTNSGNENAAVFDFVIPRGSTGAAGTNGTNGTDGAAATITVNSTTTGAVGSNAAVSNSGTSAAAMLNFTIPAGAVWYTGAGSPSTTHNNGDFYLNTTNGDVYKQTSGAWGSAIANLTGPQGSAGSASGSDTQVQFNDGGVFAGSTGLTYNKTTHALNATGTITGSNLSGSNTGDQTTITGNAGTATKLATARTINGVSFDGSANITVADSTKVPTSTTVNGHALTSNVSVTASDVGLGNVDNVKQQPAIITGTCATAAATAAKTLTLDSPWDAYTPVAGDFLLIAYTLGQSASSATLNVNALGAKSVYLQGAAANNIGHKTAANGELLYYFDGTNYNLVGSQQQVDSNTTYTSMSIAEGEAGTATTARTIQANYLNAIINYYVANALSAMNTGNIYGWQ